MDEIIGTPFGRYCLIELLGRGGMGEVWRAHDTEIDRTVAIKMLLPHFTQDERFEQRFRREARMAARLDNPHVVPIHDVGEIDGRLYVAMRLIAGQDLQALLDAGPLDPNRAVAIIEQVAAALHAAHAIGLVHRDIKPSNILLDRDDFVYLIDFGIARAAGETGLTSTGATIGTWSYMAPERFSTGHAEASSDIYALACVLYQCLTGELPFPDISLEQIIASHMTMPPPRPSARRSGICPAMDDVIAIGLAKDPTDRYATTREMATSARHALTGDPPRVPDAEPYSVAGFSETAPAPAFSHEAAALAPTQLSRPFDFKPSIAGAPMLRRPPMGRNRQPQIVIAALVAAVLLAGGIVFAISWHSDQRVTARGSSPPGQRHADHNEGRDRTDHRASCRAIRFAGATAHPRTNRRRDAHEWDGGHWNGRLF